MIFAQVGNSHRSWYLFERVNWVQSLRKTV